jgi:hypothetical protein
MDKKAVVQKILKVHELRSNNLLSNVDGASWAFQPQTMQPDLNNAISAWLKDDNAAPLVGMVRIMHTMGQLTDTEADQLLEALEIQEK